jgi:hypothetical protein
MVPRGGRRVSRGVTPKAFCRGEVGNALADQGPRPRRPPAAASASSRSASEAKAEVAAEVRARSDSKLRIGERQSAPSAPRCRPRAHGGRERGEYGHGPNHRRPSRSPFEPRPGRAVGIIAPKRPDIARRSDFIGNRTTARFPWLMASYVCAQAALLAGGESRHHKFHVAVLFQEFGSVQSEPQAHTRSRGLGCESARVCGRSRAGAKMWRSISSRCSRRCCASHRRWRPTGYRRSRAGR